MSARAGDAEIGMERRQSWLFPLMVVAAGTVTVFGCLGIAAILGFLPLSAPGSSTAGSPTYYDALERSSARLVAEVDLVEAQASKALIGRRPNQPRRQ
jgi:hypothetical protein